jgi:hypothetical protein
MTVGFETLNAYVDGELNAADTADVAMAIANDAQLAQQVSALTRLRSAIIEGAETPEIELQKAPANTNKTGSGLLVASIAFIAFITGSIMLSSFVDNPFLPQWYQETVNALESWPEGSDHDVPLIEATAPSGSLVGAYVPDLSAAKLFVNHVQETTVPVLGNMRVIGYRGTRGCRVILAVFAKGGSFPSERTLIQDGHSQTYAWRAGKLGYAMIADGMDANRFGLVVKSVHETTLRRLPVDAETRIALGESRRSSAPCLA